MITLRCTHCMTVILFYRDDRIPKTFTCPACLDALLEREIDALDKTTPDDTLPFNFDRPIRRIADF